MNHNSNDGHSRIQNRVKQFILITDEVQRGSIAQVRFGDGKTVFFDGAKDLFKFYFNIGHYQPGRSDADVGAVYVTDYYTLAPIAAKAAFFVAGSNVYGPMGRELIAFAAADQAQEFLRDHRGREILRFEAVTPEIVRSLD